MTAVARIAAPAQGRRVLAAAIAALGVAVVLSPYQWLDTWKLVGFSTAYLPYHLWGFAPFLFLAVLVGLRRVSWLYALPVVALTVVGLALTDSTGTGRAVAIGMPAVLLLALIGAWQAQARRMLVAIAALVAAIVGFGRLAGAGEYGRLQTFLVIGTSIVVEALPFVLLGAAVSAAIEVFAPGRWFAAIARLPLALQVPCVAPAGFGTPSTCSGCGSENAQTR
jgi:hypothetical protein